jgi:ElaB/YqjD/DUF883 family membrane-anchored ribosome-binding protein
MLNIFRGKNAAVGSLLQAVAPGPDYRIRYKYVVCDSYEILRRRPKMDSSRKLKQLVTDTEELLAEIADEHSPEIQQLRKRLNDSIKSTKSYLHSFRSANDDTESDEDHHDSHVKVRHVAASVNEYVRGYPWLALATGVLVASTLGIMATSATRRSLDH